MAGSSVREEERESAAGGIDGRIAARAHGAAIGGSTRGGRLVGLGVGGVDGAEVVPGVDAGVVAVGEVDLDRVVADELCVEGGDGALVRGHAGGEDGEDWSPSGCGVRASRRRGTSCGGTRWGNTKWRRRAIRW